MLQYDDSAFAFFALSMMSFYIFPCTYDSRVSVTSCIAFSCSLSQYPAVPVYSVVLHSLERLQSLRNVGRKDWSRGTNQGGRKEGPGAQKGSRRHGCPQEEGVSP